MKTLILDGYGNAGILIAKLLLEHTSEQIILAGRNLSKAESYAGNLNKEFNTRRISALKVDASDEISLTNTLKNVNLLIVAASTLDYIRQVVNAAINSNVDYFDLQLSSQGKLKNLKLKEDEIKSKGLCFITDGGFHPGLPAAMVRYAAKQFDELQSANVYSYLNPDWSSYQFSPSTGKEMIEEFNNYKPEVFSEGKWKSLKWNEYKKFNFGDSIGKQNTAPMVLEEMKFLPKDFPSLKETGFYVGGFNWFVNYISIPFAMLCLKISKRLLSKPAVKLFDFGLKKFSKPPFICILKLDASGVMINENIKLQIEISHTDGYFLTAAPVFACLLQYFDGTIRKPGLHFQANAVEVERLFSDLKMLGIKINSYKAL